MSEPVRPTAEDMARDLAADLLELRQRCGRPWQIWVLDCAEYGWPAAIRRALAAEAEVVRLQGIIEGMAARIAAQSDCLSRTAEGNADAP